LEKLKASIPDLIISDISMPRMDGFELYRAVKEITEWRPIPFIFLTAHSDADRRRHGKEIGSDDFLTKPISQEDLLVSLRGKLKRVQEIRTTTADRMREEVDGVKRTILSTLTHEVNTPLFIIKLTANLLLDESMHFEPKELQELLQRIKRSGDRLDALLNDFLVTTRITAGEAEREYNEARQIVGLNFILSHLRPKFVKMAEAADIPVVFNLAEGLGNVRVHVDQIADVAERIFSNALKFNKPGGTVTIRTLAADGNAVLEMTDTGVGMAEEQLSHIFEKFYQVNRESVEQQGAGLGLSIAHSLVQINGGRIDVQSRVDRGSTFRVVLPVV
jgi:signal transduction histidine kinase